MRLLAWLSGLAVIATGAEFYRPPADVSLEIWLSAGILAVVWSIVVWTSTVVDRIVAPNKGDSRGVFAFLIAVAFALMGMVFITGIHGDWAEKN